MSNLEENISLEQIAVIGMACRFPGASNPEMFWTNLRQGIESITFFSDEELLRAGARPEQISHMHYVKASGTLEAIEMFDAEFFGFQADEAAILDPQQRLFLECAWEALEHAGYDIERYTGQVGVYAGTSMSTYYLNNLVPNHRLLQTMNAHHIMLANEKDHLPTRVSYKLNLKGPSVSINTACSTSLVAIHFACQNLLTYQCDIALAGGVSITVPHQRGYFYHEEGHTSPDGHCRAFDHLAQGTVNGSGSGIVVLKRLEEAIHDGDSIQAIIRATAMNNDGSAKIGYLAPGIEGQTTVIQNAFSFSGIDPETIGYVEAHGTATPMGDAIEITALQRAFKTKKKQYCAIGSVKTNIGHLDAAGGVAGFMKAVLALNHHVLPPSLHFTRPNPRIDFTNSPFYVNTELSEWKNGPTPHRACVHSYGIGGTNAHVILEEYPQLPASPNNFTQKLLLLSARSLSALEVMKDNLLQYLTSHPEVDLSDVAYTLQVGRKQFDYRCSFVCCNVDEAVQLLKQRDKRQIATSLQKEKKLPVVFFFPEDNIQWYQSTCTLYQQEAVFQEKYNYCCKILKERFHIDIDAAETQRSPHKGEQTTLPLMKRFVVQYALAHLWIAWGISPQAVIGYGDGEIAAACLANVFSVEDGLGFLLYLHDPSQSQHDEEAISSPAIPGMARFLEKLSLNTPTIPCISAAGTLLRPDEVKNPHYWIQHRSQKPFFREEISRLYTRSDKILLEMGSGQVLSSVQAPKGSETAASIPSFPIYTAESTNQPLLATLGQLWLAGAELDWSTFHKREKRLRVSLPTYPFERQPYWITAQPHIANEDESVWDKKFW